MQAIQIQFGTHASASRCPTDPQALRVSDPPLPPRHHPLASSVSATSPAELYIVRKCIIHRLIYHRRFVVSQNINLRIGFLYTLTDESHELFPGGGEREKVRRDGVEGVAVIFRFPGRSNGGNLELFVPSACLPTNSSSPRPSCRLPCDQTSF